MSFNASGVAAIDGALAGQFAVGGALSTLMGSSLQGVFASSGDATHTRELALELVPQPGGILLVGTGLVALGLRWRHTRRRNRPPTGA